MSHGGGQSRRVHEKLHQGKKKCGGNNDEFARAIAKIAVAQICERAGFQTFQPSALEVLSNVTVHYIHNLGKNAQFYANLAGRTESNVFDFIQGLEDLSSAQGFTGASDVDHCLVRSGAVREIVQYVSEAENIPFAYSVPHFPVVKERNPTPSFSQFGEQPPMDHIPAWLPKIPDTQEHVELPTGIEGVADSTLDKAVSAKQPRNTDGSLLNTPQQFTCNGSERPSSFATLDVLKKKQVAEHNPFLASPLQFGEKEVSYVAPPAQLPSEVVLNNPVEQNHAMDNHVSVLDTFAPAIEAMKNRVSDSEEGQNVVLLNQRPVIKFKIGVVKKPLDSGSENRDVGRYGLWFARDDHQNDEQKRAKEILKQSMENPGEEPNCKSRND